MEFFRRLKHDAAESSASASEELSMVLAAWGAFSGGAAQKRCRFIDGWMTQEGEAQANPRKSDGSCHRLRGLYLEQARAEALRNVQAAAAAAGARARAEANRDGGEPDRGTGHAGEPERGEVNAGRSYEGNGTWGETSGREGSEGWVGWAEHKNGDHMNNAGGGSTRGPRSSEQRRKGGMIGERDDQVELSRRAWRFQGETKTRDREGLNKIGVDTRLHDRLLNSRSPGYGTETNVKMGVEQASIVSHDGQMGFGDRVDRVLDKCAQVVGQHARTHSSSATANKTESIRRKGYLSEKRGRAQGGRGSGGESCLFEERTSTNSNAVSKVGGVQEDSEGCNNCSRGAHPASESREVLEDGSCSGESEGSASGENATRKRRARRYGEDPIEGRGGDRRKRRHRSPNRNNGSRTVGTSSDWGGCHWTISANAGGHSGGEFVWGREGSSEGRGSDASTSSNDRQRERTVGNGPMLKDPTGGRGRRQERPPACADADEIAKPGRAFDVVGTPKQTWNHALDTLIGELRTAGHGTLQRNLKKRTVDKSRYNYCEVLCKHSGQPRRKAPTPAEAKRRRSASKKMGCPFKIVITWPLRESNPSISSASCQHSHDPRGLVPSAAERTLPPSVVGERMDDVRRWTASNISAREIIKMLETDQDGLLLCKAGKRKVYNVMRKVKDELCSILEYASHSGSTSGSEPGPDCKQTSDAQGRLLGTTWSAREAQDKAARFEGCLQGRVYASMMAKSKGYVQDVMRSLPPHEALAVQDKVGDYVKLLLKPPGGRMRQRPRQAAPEGAEQNKVRPPSSLPDTWERRGEGLRR